MLLISHAHFICSLAAWTSSSKSLFNLDLLTQRCLTHDCVRPCAGHILVLPAEILLLNPAPSYPTGVCKLYQGGPHTPEIHVPTEIFSSSSAPSPFSFLSSQACFVIWPIMFVLTALSTPSHFSRNPHSSFPFPTAHPSLP